MSDIIFARLQEWRQKAAAGTMTLDECREAIAAIRKERVQASAVSSVSKERKATATAKAKAAPINSDDLLGELEGL